MKKTAKATRHETARKPAKLKMKRKAKLKRPALHKIKARARAPKMKLRKKPVLPVRMARPNVIKARAAKITPISERSSDRPKNARLDGRVFTDSREYDRRVFVRFDAAGKELVKEIAGESGLSPYIAHFAAEAAQAGKELVATPASTKEAGVFARFATPAVKKMVAAAAAKCGVSLSSYAAYFAVEAAKAGKLMSAAKEAKTAAAS
jgi:hypothetical protein